MQASVLSTFLRSAFAAMLLVTFALCSDHQTILYNFGNGMDGRGPGGGLMMDSGGNVYGVTNGGGNFTNCLAGCGTAFKLSPTPSGDWTETVLYDFGAGSGDGISPTGSLIMDSHGNLYGVTEEGGTHGVGTVFELSSQGSGQWTETILYNFGTNSDERFPSSGLIMDAAGNLYGTASDGGNYGWGTAFEVSPGSGGNWTETTLHSFGNGTDGVLPTGSLIMDAAGDLYGTTYQGGEGQGVCQNSGCGTVYELVPGAGGWTEKVLHSFQQVEGTGLQGGVIMDAVGNLYGTAYQGGNITGNNCAPFGCGTVFEVSPDGSGGWTETAVHIFSGQPDTGYSQGPLMLDSAGNLYGVGSGSVFSPAAVFELSPQHGNWQEALLFLFAQVDSPASGVIMDRWGRLYGTAGGGTYSQGIAYKLTPSSVRVLSHAQ